MTTLSNVPSVWALFSSLGALARFRAPHDAHGREVRANALTHLASHLKDLRARTPRRHLQLAAGSLKPFTPPVVRDEVDELLDALAVLARADASDTARAVALEKLTGYFDAQLEKLEKATASGRTPPKKPEQASAAAGSKSKPTPPSPRSTLAKVNAEIAALTQRIERAEKASAVGTRPHVAPPRPSPRPRLPTTDPVIDRIERARRATMGETAKQRGGKPTPLTASQRAAIIAASGD